MRPRGASHQGILSRARKTTGCVLLRRHRFLGRRAGGAAFGVLYPLWAHAGAPLQPIPLYLSPIVNGVAEPGVVAVLAVTGGVLIAPAALITLGITPDAGQPGTSQPGARLPAAKSDRFIPTSGKTAAVIDMQSQIIRLTFPASDLIDSVTAVSTPSVAAPSRSGTGAFVNYAFSFTPPSGGGPTTRHFSIAGTISGALFSPAGSLSASSLLQLPKPGGGESEFTRLNTTYEFDQPQIPLAIRAGDVMTAPPGWARAEFLGGLQIETDYELQPSQVTFPTPIIGQTLAQPSDVALLVNNAVAYSGNANAGPMSLVGIPVISGLNEVTIQTRSASGQVSSQTVPFYASSTMLKPGLTDYDVTVGALRHHYGQTNNLYATPVFDATVNHGLTSALTLTLHTELAPNLVLLGGGGETAGRWGDLTAAYAFSDHQPTVTAGGRTGHLYSVQFTRESPDFGIAAGITAATSGYNDLGIESESSYPRLAWHVSGTAALPARLGNITLGVTEQSATRHSRDAFFLASYSVNVFGRINISVSCFRGDLRAFGVSSVNEGCNAGMSLSLGRIGTASGSAAFGSAQSPEFGQTVQTSPAGPLGFGASATNETGDYLFRTLRFQDIAHDADLAADVGQSGASYSSEFDLSGSVVAMDGLYFSRPTNTSFAVVDFGYPKIPVRLSNQPVGSTGGSGRMLIPGLVPNYPNRLSIDAGAVPLNIEIGDDEMVVVPPRVGGVLVRFPMQKLDAAYLEIKLKAGGHPPAGSLLYEQGSETPIVIGYDGYVYIQNPPRHLVATIIMTTGTCNIDARLVVSVHNAVVGRPVICGT